MIIEISVAVIAVAFVALVIYLIIFMSEVRDNLRQVKKILENTDDISLDFRNKMESLNPFFQTFTNLGEIAEKETKLLKNRLIASLETEVNAPHVEVRLTRGDGDFKKDILELAGLGIRLWKNLKRR